MNIKTLFLLIFSVFVSSNMVGQLDVNSTAPEFSLDTIYNTSGKNTSTLESLKGKTIILDFWATWCTPCIAAFPENNKLYNKYKSQDVVFIAITDDSKKGIENFLKRKPVDFWIAQDKSGIVFKKYKVNGRPQMYIIDKNGRIVYEGNRITDSTIEQALNLEVTLPAEIAKPLSIMSNGGFSPGEDPVYNGMYRMLGNDIRKNRPRLIEQMIIRPSLEEKAGSYGSKRMNGYIGVTYTAFTIKRIFFMTHQLSSYLWIRDNTKLKDRLDIIYWKKCESFDNAFLEIETALSKGLSIKVDTIAKTTDVNTLYLDEKSNLVKKRNQIEDGTFKFYTHIDIIISKLEYKSKEFFTLDDSLKDVYIDNTLMNSKQLNLATKSEVLGFLQTRGIINKREIKEIMTYEINEQ